VLVLLFVGNCLVHNISQEIDIVPGLCISRGPGVSSVIDSLPALCTSLGPSLSSAIVSLTDLSNSQQR